MRCDAGQAPAPSPQVNSAGVYYLFRFYSERLEILFSFFTSIPPIEKAFLELDPLINPLAKLADG
jgi:hypothetical protein